MTVAEIASQREITSVLHFTTNSGALGILTSRALKSRARLNEDQQLIHIFQPNAAYRGKDAAWLDYVNLSISRINSGFFDICAGCWHRGRDFWWCVLEFSPEILTHRGVWFTTTNNIYTGVLRGEGADGMRRMFAPEITRWIGSVVRRGDGLALRFPTCPQAEVLYPQEVSTDYLLKMHVQTADAADELAAQLSMAGHRSVPIEVTPSMFAGER